MKDLKSWWQIAMPHKDIREGKFDESIFAADLGEVYAGRGAIDYKDPITFFKKTYLTKGLSSMLSDVLSRVAGKGKGEKVIQLQTPFGGGKTHTLLSLYHLFNKPGEIKNIDTVKDLLEKNKIKELPTVKVIVLVGTALNPQNDRTLWGELAYQIGAKAYKTVEDNDKNKIAPGADDLSKILSDAQPCLILMDEVLQYLTKAYGVKVGDGSLGGQTLSFLQELTIAVANNENCVLVATLPSSIQEQYDEKTEEAFGKLTRVFGRVEAIRTPVEGEEIYEIIRRRLFENIGVEKDRKQVAQVYWDLYQKLSADLPRKVKEVGYRDKIEKAYPFHPELVEIFYERWGSLPGFQRTRGVLRFLARVVGDLYQNPNSGAIIQPAFINLDNQNLRSELTKFVGVTYESVIASDISGPSAKAPRIDRELGTEYARERISEGLATSIFLYSFTGSKGKGANEQQLRLSVLTPTLTPSIIAEGLSRLSRQLWFLNSDGGGIYKFTTQPNINKMLVDKEDALNEDDVFELVSQKLKDIVGYSHFKPYIWPVEDRDVDDIPELSLVVLSLDYVFNDKEETEAKKFIEKLLENHSGTFRKYKNSIIFLVADGEGRKNLLSHIKRLLALRSIEDDYKGEEKLADEQMKDLNIRLSDAEQKTNAVIHNVYRHVVVAGSGKEALRQFDLGLQTVDGDKTLSEKVYETLKAHEKLLDRLDPSLLTSKRFGVWPENEELISLKKLKENFSQYTHLPMLETLQVLAGTASIGVERGFFGYALGDGIQFSPNNVFNSQNPIEVNNVEFSENSWLVNPKKLKEILPESVTVPTSSEETNAGTPPFIFGNQQETQGLAEGKKYQNVSIKAKIPWERWSDFLDYAIKFLKEDNAELEIDVDMKAKSEDGIKEKTVDDIKESLDQKGIDAEVKTEKE